MSKLEKVPVFGVGITVCDYDLAVAAILDAARKRESFAVSALAVHGLMEAVHDPALRALVDRIDLVTPDGQPVRWAMNTLAGTALTDRVYGPDLVAMVCEAAAREGLSVFLFGSTETTCERMATELIRRYPGITIAGAQADRFRDATPEEDAADVELINRSGANIVLVGRGCPRQERWVAEHLGRVDAAMLAVGAAFDYFAGALRPSPRWVQRAGLQWAHRLAQEPRRLWRRYLVTNSQFLARFASELVQRRV